jgi:cobalamin synthase
VAAALGREALPALAVALVVTLVAGRYFRRVLGGITGDCLGAANQAVELGVYLALAWTAGGGMRSASTCGSEGPPCSSSWCDTA